jgi:hypothetical protein
MLLHELHGHILPPYRIVIVHIFYINETTALS